MTAVSDPLKRKPPPPFPFSVLTGFLGAGKTTLLNRLLRDPLLADTLVLINEFGETGLDHLLVEKVDGDMILMSSGCVCCTIRGDLIDTLEDVLRRYDNGRMKPFGRVLVETTGLADPAPVLHTIMNHPYLMLRFQLDSVITLVDAVNGMRTLDAYMEAVKQAAVADRIVISKSDLCESGEMKAQLAALRGRLTRLNPGAVLLDAAQGEAADAAHLLDAGLYNPATKAPQVRKWLNAEAFAGVLASARPHEHEANKHDEDIRAFVLKAASPVAPASLQLFLDMLRELHGSSLLRLKGIVALADDPARPLVVHGVQHVFHPPQRLETWPDRDHGTRIVLIVRDIDPGHIRGLWGAFTGAVAIDTPDAQALAVNPLKPSSGGLFTHS